MTSELSIIIPTLNEAEALPALLSDIVSQQGIHCEIIVADGGSSDETCTLANQVFDSGQLLGRCLFGSPGRGRQLNTGACAASSEWLLFLHADSRLPDHYQLQKALFFMQRHQQQLDSDALAGRFSLRFDLPAESVPVPLYYYETKARLGRPGCIHGDQGLLLPRSFFDRVGPFREDLPVMEDTCLAEVIRNNGQWLLLPGDILTSPRRFEVEGLKERQTLNALMMNFLDIGWLDFLVSGVQIYQQQDRTRPLQLPSFFSHLAKLLGNLSFRKRWSIWIATGGYVRSQAWQLGLALDCRRARRNNTKRPVISYRWLTWFDRYFDPITDHWPGRALTALLVRIWFACQPKAKH